MSLAAALASQTLSVLITDPKLDAPWPNHYGVWEDEFASVGLEDCATARYPKTTVYSGPRKILLDRPYLRVDRVKLKERFTFRARNANVHFRSQRVDDVNHVSNSWSLVRFEGPDDGTDDDREVRARLVVDCTGHALQFSDVGKGGGTFEEPWAQAAYGIEARVKEYPFEKDEMLLMDFRDGHMTGGWKEASEKRPTFLYVFPSGERKAFFEETSVIAPTAVAFEELRERLLKRLQYEGIEVEEVLEEEFSLIPMGGSLPVKGRVLGFGGAAGLVHPATGYMVARTVRMADRISGVIARGLASVGEDGDVRRVSRMAWDETWSVSMLRQRDFLNFGAELLGVLDMEQSRSFFEAFFKLPRDLWARFLGYELDGPGIRALFALWFFAIADNDIRICLLRGIVEIGGWRLIRSVLPEAVSAWQED